MLLEVNDEEAIATTRDIDFTCPKCKKHVRGLAIRSKAGFGNSLDFHINPAITAGQRKCPDQNCKTHIFFAAREDKVLVIYPSPLIDFNYTDIPADIVTSFEEALKCFSSECYVASAIMVRKTLEILCDERGITGKTLHLRLQSLATTMILPKEMIDAAMLLKSLGNDAAHLIAKDFYQVGRDEAEAGIELAKELFEICCVPHISNYVAF